MKKVSVVLLILSLSLVLSGIAFAESFTTNFDAAISPVWTEVYGAAKLDEVDGNKVLNLAPGAEGGLIYKHEEGIVARLEVRLRVDSYKFKFRLRDAAGEQIMRFFVEDDGDLKWQRFSNAHKADYSDIETGNFYTYVLEWDNSSFKASILVDGEEILLGEDQLSNPAAQFELYSNNPGKIYVDSVKYTELK